MASANWFHDYDAGPFADVFASPLGHVFIRFFERPDVAIRVETAADLSRPAAEALARPALAALGPELRSRRARQLFGHMLRHLNEKLGFVLDQPDVRISNGVLFKRAARYRRR